MYSNKNTKGGRLIGSFLDFNFLWQFSLQYMLQINEHKKGKVSQAGSEHKISRKVAFLCAANLFSGLSPLYSSWLNKFFSYESGECVLSYFCSCYNHFPNESAICTLHTLTLYTHLPFLTLSHRPHFHKRAFQKSQHKPVECQ